MRHHLTSDLVRCGIVLYLWEKCSFFFVAFFFIRSLRFL